MKKLFSSLIVLSVALLITFNTSAQSANTSLSNLASATKINHSLTPGTTNSLSLGTSTIGWRNLYLTNGLYVDNHRFINNSGSGNNFIGTDAGKSITSGVNNTGAGVYALYSNTSGNSNTAAGNGALSYNTMGSYNTSSGFYALGYSVAGNYNTANGFYALLNNTNSYNTATGAYALYKNNSGYNNTAIGASALYYTTSGIDNTATGLNALTANISGNHNTAVGVDALTKTIASDFNTAVGSEAGSLYDNGYNNVFIGANVDVNGAGYYNDIAIGQGTVCTDVSQVTMGNSATTSYRAYANWSNISDGRFKKNIQLNVPGLTFINKLQPVTYTLDATGLDNFLHQNQKQDKQIDDKAKTAMTNALSAKEKIVHTGFIAQDVEKAAKSLNYDFSGVDAAKNDKDVYGLRYAEFVVPLVKGEQELSKQNDSLKSVVNSLQNQINELKSMIVSSVNSLQSAVSSASLQQNTPNPFSSSTSIGYVLPQTYSSAKIIISDSKGTTLKQISLNTKGKGNVNVDAATLASGAYYYTLYVDGKMIDSKQMMSSK